MKVVTILGTRPEIIRLSRIIPELDRHCDHVLVHTGQNDDPNLSDRFFRELQIRPPDIHLGVQTNGFAHQAAEILARGGDILEQVRPDRVLILGDTNSGLLSLVAARMGIPVYHMEAGNRCYDNRVPEEINRRIIDHSSAVLMPYTHRSMENLLREGIERQRIYVIGNPLYEVIQTWSAQIDSCGILERLNLTAGQFFLATLHRSENVDLPVRLESFCRGLSRIAHDYDQPLVLSLHPRTADKLQKFGLRILSESVLVCEPLGFVEFVKLERNARCVLTDSGTVQEECCIFHVPNVTLRDVTERAETVEAGSNILSGPAPDSILQATQVALSVGCDWEPPREYVQLNVSRAVLKIVLGYEHIRAAKCAGVSAPY